MNLKLIKPYLSLTSFPDVDLPDFTIVTGLNGSGKTHLLQAIQGGSAEISEIPLESISMFSWENIQPVEEGAFNSTADAENESRAVYRALQKAKSQIENEVRDQILSTITFPTPTISDLLGKSVEDLERSFGEDAAKAMPGALSVFDRRVETDLGSARWRLVQTVMSISGKSFMDLTEEDFSSDHVPHWGTTQVFRNAFGRLFVTYRDMVLKNELRELRLSKGTSAESPLSSDEFVDRYGEPPWETINAVFADAGLGFALDPPPPDDFKPFAPVLRKLDSGVAVSFSSLSSGEKVMMSVALAMFYSKDNRQVPSYPKLLLLDEIDAPLHPSMCKTLVDVLSQTLVNKFKVKVIATTHSPSTIAFSPEEAIFMMEPSNPGLHKVSKDQALNALTFGVPTLSISYGGRRQVLVESPTDAEVYDLVYRILKATLGSERSLEFIATGVRTKVGDVNTGCAQVRRLVAEMAGAENKSVFGLVDWDGEAQSGGRIVVLAEGARNGIENAMFDPLVLCHLIATDGRTHLAQIGQTEEFTSSSLATWQGPQLQEISNQVQAKVLDRPIGAQVEVTYHGGLSLLVDSEYLTMDDHELEERVITAFPALRAHNRHAGDLLKRVADTVFRNHSSVIPVEFVAAFEALLAADSH